MSTLIKSKSSLLNLGIILAINLLSNSRLEKNLLLELVNGATAETFCEQSANAKM
jgi:hypothetical protein